MEGIKMRHHCTNASRVLLAYTQIVRPLFWPRSEYNATCFKCLHKRGHLKKYLISIGYNFNPSIFGWFVCFFVYLWKSRKCVSCPLEWYYCTDRSQYEMNKVASWCEWLKTQGCVCVKPLRDKALIVHFGFPLLEWNRNTNDLRCIKLHPLCSLWS